MNIEIQWSGRLGNNLLQLIHAVGVAVEKNYNIILPKHNYFTKDYLVMNPAIHKRMPRVDASKYTVDWSETTKQKVIQCVKGVFRIQNPTPLPPNEVIIHIRSGDIFGTNPHPLYIMPPMSYYRSILDTNTFSKIHILSEDTNNPCVEALLKEYPHAEWKQRRLYDDICVFLGASTVIESFGSFPSLLILSDFVKKIYKPSYQIDTIVPKHVIVERIMLEEYHKAQSPWTNSQEQRARMIT